MSPLNVLFVCTHNRCRSILCEAIVNHKSNGRLNAFSAGSSPAGQVHPLTLHFLAEKGISTDGLKSQSWDEYADSDIDVVITVCDQAANEVCPVWIGSAVKLHWGLNDASKAPESQADEAFHNLMLVIDERIDKLLSVIDKHDEKDALLADIKKIIVED